MTNCNDIVMLTKNKIVVRCLQQGKCALCKKPGDHVHHIDGAHYDNNVENLVFLCRRCHGIVHRGTRALYRESAACSSKYQKAFGHLMTWSRIIKMARSEFCTRVGGRYPEINFLEMSNSKFSKTLKQIANKA